MRGYKPTRLRMSKNILAVVLGTAAAGVFPLTSGTALAQDNAILEEIIVTAQRREENLQEVPISVTAVSGERLSPLFEGGEDIRAMATRIPSLHVESSNGRLAPRFYMRGLGNTDFDLAASQSVSILFDEVVQENVILKSFPLFDIERVEVLRGPQGTLFGRNTPAGIVKFDTRKPTEDFDGYAIGTIGTAGTMNVEGALGGSLNAANTLMGRISVLSQNRDDWIDNGFTGESDVMGGWNEFAWRGQLMWQATDSLSALLNLHGRDMDNGTAAIFQANVVDMGNNDLNGNFNRDMVYFDAGDNNPQEAQGNGGLLKLDFDFASDMTLTSITSYETVSNYSRGDIDGGVLDFSGTATIPPGVTFDPAAPFQFGGTALTFPGTITLNSESQDGLDDLEQITQEFRLASQATDRLFWQAGAFFFDSDFTIRTVVFFAPDTVLRHTNTAWAAFGQVGFDLTDRLNITAGVRYTDDEKDLEAIASNGPVTPVNVSDDQVSWDVSALFSINDNVNTYVRLANGFRAPTIQGRDIAFGAPPSTAESETINSVEFGFKSTLADSRIRLNGAIYYYEISDQQHTAIGGSGNFVQLVNADKGIGTGFDFDAEFLITDSLSTTVGASYNNTEIDDSSLRVATCASLLCTPLDPLDANGFALVDGNSFPQAPEYTFNVVLRYVAPVDGGDLFFQTDWAFQGDAQFFLYEAAEFHSDDIFEGGVRTGFTADDDRWELAVFGRNITDEENLKGGIDFSNNVGFVNDRRVWGASLKINFGAF